MSSLNWKEIGLIIEEADLEGSKIQGVIQNSFHSLTWEMYKPGRGRFLFYTEVATPESRLHLLSSDKKLEKTKKLQRFIQFTRKNIEGSVITKCYQMPYDRIVVWELNNHGRLMKIFIRLFSGSGANVIVNDENNKILDLLLRRPGRDEMSGEILKTDIRTQESGEYSVREYTGSFNSFIEKTFSEIQTEDIYSVLRKQVENRKEKEITRILSSLRSAEKTIEQNKNYEEYRITADLLSAFSYQIKRGEEQVELHNWQDNSTIVVKLDKSLSPGDNVQNYYDKYQKAKGTYINARSEAERLENELKVTEQKFDKALEETDNRDTDIKRMKAILEKTDSPVQVHEGPGIRCTSGGFEIIAGRNAKENDELLRHYAKGGDMWLHVRDFPGGYVFIKFKRNKTIPLDVLLDAANLAVLFSKGRNASSVDLYYTEVRYLRRAKNGKTGLVLPTQEKNLTIKPDKSRLERLLPGKEEGIAYSD